MVAIAICCLMTFAVARQIYFSFSDVASLRAMAGASPEWTQGDSSRNLALLAGIKTAQDKARAVYPYSVVPGGVSTPGELREASKHDPLVALHYAGFDFGNARVVRLKHPRLVYLSYRRKDKIFWTKRQVKLCEGEKVLTDGKMMARTRCANRVSAAPQRAISAQEPAAAELDRPVIAGGTAFVAPFPVKFESALLHRRPEWFDPADPPSRWGYGPYAGNDFPITFPPPFPGGAAGGVCEPAKPKPSHNAGFVTLGFTGEAEGTKAPKKNACPPGPPGTPGPPGPPATVPEPATIVLMSTGIAAMYLRYRKGRNS